MPISCIPLGEWMKMADLAAELRAAGSSRVCAHASHSVLRADWLTRGGALWWRDHKLAKLSQYTVPSQYYVNHQGKLKFFTPELKNTSMWPCEPCHLTSRDPSRHWGDKYFVETQAHRGRTCTMEQKIPGSILGEELSCKWHFAGTEVDFVLLSYFCNKFSRCSILGNWPTDTFCIKTQLPQKPESVNNSCLYASCCQVKGSWHTKQ